jgi:hypothetical protein
MISRARSSRHFDQGAVVAFALILAAAPAPAFAYIDPGSGALVWQIALSAFFGALFIVRRAIGQALRALRPNRQRPRDPSAPEG